MQLRMKKNKKPAAKRTLTYDAALLGDRMDELVIRGCCGSCEASRKEDFDLLIIKELTRNKHQEIICKKRMAVLQK